MVGKWMRGKRGMMALAVALLIGLVGTAFGAEAGRPGCRLCGMYLDLYPRTVAQATDKAGQTESVCGVADLIRLVSEAGGPNAFSRIVVHDFASGAEVAAAEASYVIGSDMVPDMIPNLIAFGDQAAAEKFRQEHGGEIITFDQALNAISPMGMTMPVRIEQAVPAPAGSFNFGVGVMAMKLDTVLVGSDRQTPEEFIRGKMMGPKEMNSRAATTMLSYALTDSATLTLKAKEYDKKMEMYTNGGAAVSTLRNNGWGDLDLNLRYNLWHDSYYSRFVTLLAGTTLPTGKFEMRFLDYPGMQTGTGAASVYGGLLGSMRFGNFWLHGQASRTAKFENSDDFRFGDETTLGAALHYTPTSDLMLGVELDGVWTDHNEYRDVDVARSGGFRSTAAALARWRFLTAFGGNATLLLSAAVPVYEDLNVYNMGGGYSGSAMVSFSRRFAAF